MSKPENIKEKVKVCMFDQYGTVVDMQTGLWEIAVDFLKAKRWTGNAYSFVTWWRRTHFENSMIDALCDRGHTPYREIGQRAVAYEPPDATGGRYPSPRQAPGRDGCRQCCSRSAL